VWGGRFRLPFCQLLNLASGLPRKFQWPGAMSSLTVARQRGICTRFPILLKVRRTRELFQSRMTVIAGRGEVNAALPKRAELADVIPKGRAGASKRDLTTASGCSGVQRIPIPTTTCARYSPENATHAASRRKVPLLRSFGPQIRDDKLQECSGP
jgi:hypothetical protein